MLTANFRSFSLIGFQIGSPSMFTSSAGFLLKKIGGGSAFTSFTSLGMIWLLSMLASTRSREITRSWSGIALTISATTSRVSSFFTVGKLRLGHLEDREAHQPLRDRHLRVGLDLERAEGRFGRAFRLVAHRSVRDRVLLVGPARHLGLVDHDVPPARGRVGTRPPCVTRWLRRVVRRGGRPERQSRSWPAASPWWVVLVAAGAVGAGVCCGAAGEERRESGPATGHCDRDDPVGPSRCSKLVHFITLQTTPRNDCTSRCTRVPRDRLPMLS